MSHTPSLHRAVVIVGLDVLLVVSLLWLAANAGYPFS
jgi:hypothetical protein